MAGYPETLACSGAAFSLDRGFVNGAPVFARWANLWGGAGVRNRAFDHESGLTMQVFQTGKCVNTFLMHQQLFESTLNEL